MLKSFSKTQLGKFIIYTVIAFTWITVSIFIFQEKEKVLKVKNSDVHVIVYDDDYMITEKDSVKKIWKAVI